jgi:hypothetical protein
MKRALLTAVSAIIVMVSPRPLPTQPTYVTTGIFLAAIEEGGRIFTPVRLLPFGHPEALNHQFPTVVQFHQGEAQVLVLLGQAAGLRLEATLERYPTEPDSLWPYAPFVPPPLKALKEAPVIRQGAQDSPLPGLRAVAYQDRFPIGFIVDTRGLSLAERHMEHATTMGLDVTRAEFVGALEATSHLVPEQGAALLVFER